MNETMTVVHISIACPNTQHPPPSHLTCRLVIKSGAVAVKITYRRCSISHVPRNSQSPYLPSRLCRAAVATASATSRTLTRALTNHPAAWESCDAARAGRRPSPSVHHPPVGHTHRIGPCRKRWSTPTRAAYGRTRSRTRSRRAGGRRVRENTSLPPNADPAH